MKKIVFSLLLMVLPATAFPAGGGMHLDPVEVDVTDQEALQRGAKYFVNYCMGCHALKYQRYVRTAAALGLTEQEVKDNLMFVGDKIGQPMSIAMTSGDGARWFGAPPPDLSLIVRARPHGESYLYTYLRSFYRDEKRPLGVNNTVFPDVGMPHVLWELQGVQDAVYREGKDAAGNPTQVFDHLELTQPGKMSTAEYDQLVKDMVTFISYVGEPAQHERKVLGIYVLMFLAVFFVLAYLLKKEYWKDVH
jgi:ubiquinol-cytochrome c reductase cytochrome c1 subunit